MESFINLLVWTHHLKMVLLKEKIGIFLRYLKLFYFKWKFQKNLGQMLFLQFVSYSIRCHLLFFIVIFLILSYFLLYHCFLSNLICTCFVWDDRSHITKLDLKSLKYVFLDYSNLQKGTYVSLQSLIIILCLSMLHSLSLPFFFSPSPINKSQEEDDLLVYSVKQVSIP